MKCPNCGCELPKKAMFCGACGTKIEPTDSVKNTPKKKQTKLLIIIGSVVVLVVIAVIVILIALKPTKNESNPIVPAIIEETTSAESVSAEQYFRSELCKDYYAAINSTIKTLHYRYDNGERQFDCSGFVNLILDHHVVDFDGNGKDDIVTFSLEIDDSKSLTEDHYGNIMLYTRVYLADEDTFKLYSESEKPFNENMSDYVKSEFDINVIKCTDNTYRIVQYEWIEDERKLYGDEKPYYSPDDSVGDFADTAAIYSFREKGINEVLKIYRSVTHHKGMPEAESHGYFTAKNGGEYNTLFIGGITKVTTISGVDYPKLDEVISGEFQSESEACEAINEELKQIGLESYQLKPFKWDERLEGYFSEPGEAPCCLSMTIDETNDSSGKLIIKVKKE